MPKAFTTEQRIKRAKQKWRAFQSEMEQLLSNVTTIVEPQLTGRPKIAAIQETVCAFFDIPHSGLVGQTRLEKFSIPRQIGMQLCREFTKHSLGEIGEDFGGRDHGTVSWASTRVVECCGNDKEYRKNVDALRIKVADRIENLETPLLAGLVA